MKVTVENHIGEAIEVTLRSATHGDRKKWLAESEKINETIPPNDGETKEEFAARKDAEERKAIHAFQEFREKFLKTHIVTPQEIDLDQLPSTSADTLFKSLEKDMDFSTGLSSKFSNTQVKKEQS